MPPLASLTILAVSLAGQVAAQTTTVSDSGLNFASWSSHMSDFPEETYCPQTTPNPMESEYDSCRSTAFDMAWNCPGAETHASRMACVCSSIVQMSSCLTAYCPSNTVVASILSKDQEDYTSIYGCPSRLGAAAGAGGGGNAGSGGNGDPAGPTDTASPSKNVGAGGGLHGALGGGGGGGWTMGMAVVLGGAVGLVAVVL